MKINWKPLCIILYRDDLGKRDGLKNYGLANGPIIRILTSEKNNKIVHEHELEHVRQFWKMGIFHCLLLVFPRYRRWVEKRAEERSRR